MIFLSSHTETFLYHVYINMLGFNFEKQRQGTLKVFRVKSIYYLDRFTLHISRGELKFHESTNIKLQVSLLFIALTREELKLTVCYFQDIYYIMNLLRRESSYNMKK